MERVFILPGTASPTSSAEYTDTYAMIREEAIRRHLRVEIPTYPGQCGEKSGRLSFKSAVESTRPLARSFHPDWIIGRSFGCHVAAGLVQLEESWVSACLGIVMWGPTLGRTWARYLETHDFRAKVTNRGRELNVYLADDFFDSVPAIEQEVQKIRCPLRVVRGSLDDDNSREDLKILAAMHRNMQPAGKREAIEIVGLRHTFISGSICQSALEAYLRSLFEPIEDRQEVLTIGDRDLDSHS